MSNANKFMSTVVKRANALRGLILIELDFLFPSKGLKISWLEERCGPCWIKVQHHQLYHGFLYVIRDHVSHPKTPNRQNLMTTLINSFFQLPKKQQLYCWRRIAEFFIWNYWSQPLWQIFKQLNTCQNGPCDITVNLLTNELDQVNLFSTPIESQEIIAKPLNLTF